MTQAVQSRPTVQLSQRALVFVKAIADGQWFRDLLRRYQPTNLTLHDASLVGSRVLVTAAQEFDLQAFPMKSHAIYADQSAVSQALRQPGTSLDHENELLKGKVLCNPEHIVCCLASEVLIDPIPLYRSGESPEPTSASKPSVLIAHVGGGEVDEVRTMLCADSASTPEGMMRYTWPKGDISYIQNPLWRDMERLRPAINALRFRCESDYRALDGH